MKRIGKKRTGKMGGAHIKKTMSRTRIMNPKIISSMRK